MRWLAVAGLALGIPVCMRAQELPAGPPRFRSEVALVEVAAVVTGEGGRSLADLTPADIEIREDGEVRTLVSLRRLQGKASARTTSLPTALAGAQVEQLATNAGLADQPAFVLLLDDLNTSPYDAHRVIRASLGALAAIPAGALVAVATTSGRDGSPLTLSHPGEAHRVSVRNFRGQVLLSPPSIMPRGRSAVDAPCGLGSRAQDCADPTRASRRSDALRQIARVLGSAGSRRKVVLWLTPDMGVSPLDPEGNRRAQRAALAQVLGADVAVYTVNPVEGQAEVRDPRGVHGGKMEDARPDRRSGGAYRVGPGASGVFGPGGGTIDLETDDMVAVTLPLLAETSGGRHITAANELESVLARVVEQNTTSYVLAYESAVSRTPGRHRIDIRVHRPEARVYARRGYIVLPAAAGTAAASEPSPRQRLMRAAINGSVPQGTLALVVHVAPQFAEARQGRAIVTVRLGDAAIADGPVDLLFATADDSGRISNHRQLQIPPPPAGLPGEVSTELTLARGRHQLRVVGVSGDGTRTGLALASIEISEPRGDMVMTPPVVLFSTAGRVHPTAVRAFASGDPLGLQVHVGGRRVSQQRVSVRMSLVDAGGRTARDVAAVFDAEPKADRLRATALVPTLGLAAGAYLLVAEARATGETAVVRHAIPITLAGATAPPSQSDR